MFCRPNASNCSEDLIPSAGWTNKILYTKKVQVILTDFGTWQSSFHFKIRAYFIFFQYSCFQYLFSKMTNTKTPQFAAQRVYALTQWSSRQIERIVSLCRWKYARIGFLQPPHNSPPYYIYCIEFNCGWWTFA